MLLSQVVETSQQVSETSKRLRKIDLLATLLRQLDPAETEITVAFLSGLTRQGRIGIGWATLNNATAPPAEAPSLAIRDVDNALNELASVKGQGSEQRRRQLLHAVFARATKTEQHFLTRLLIGELRQGALEGIMLEALAKASGVGADRIRRAVMLRGATALVARAVLAYGEAGLSHFDVQLFRPVQPMLAQTSDDVASALGDLGEATLEYKLDGARVQVHRQGDEVAVFSRRLNNVTHAVPEIVEAVRAMPGENLILDGEVLALTPEGRPQPFQITMRRFGRKLNVDQMRSQQPLTPFWFDLLYFDGQNLMDETQSRRFQVLHDVSPQGSVIANTVTADPETAAGFLRGALDRGHEGVMAKATDSIYAAGARGQSWLKIKQARTLDLVILAAEWGHGRRQGWLSNLHLGARDTEKGGYAMLGKTFKGLTDKMLAWQTEKLLELEIGRDRYTVHVEPRLVAEIAFNEIQISSRYPSGLALRFARVKRYRPDKSATDADTFETVKQMAGLER